MFPNEIFSDIEKKDGIVAVIFFLFIFIFAFLSLYLVKISPLFSLMRNSTNNIYKIFFALIMDMPAFITVIFVLKLRRQKINTVCLRKQGLKSSIVIGVTLIFMLCVYRISNNGFSVNLVYSIFFYVIFIGFYEELIFRGFLWPRLVVGFGKTRGTILCGVFFGMIHLPMDIVLNNKTVFETFILGNTSNVNILGGVVGALWFIFIYSRNSNILLPSFIHGIQDML